MAEGVNTSDYIFLIITKRLTERMDEYIRTDCAMHCVANANDIVNDQNVVSLYRNAF